MSMVGLEGSDRVAVALEVLRAYCEGNLAMLETHSRLYSTNFVLRGVDTIMSALYLNFAGVEDIIARQARSGSDFDFRGVAAAVARVRDGVAVTDNETKLLLDATVELASILLHDNELTLDQLWDGIQVMMLEEML